MDLKLHRHSVAIETSTMWVYTNYNGKVDLTGCGHVHMGSLVYALFNRTIQFVAKTTTFVCISSVLFCLLVLLVLYIK